MRLSSFGIVGSFQRNTRTRLILAAALGALITFMAPTDACAQVATSAPIPDIDAATWRLEVTGPALGSPFTLTYEELAGMERVGKREQMICPGLYAYFADWEGVPLSALLAMGKATPDYQEVTFSSADGYVASFNRDEVDSHLLFIAILKNGTPLPREQGYPARVVAVGFTGGRWVRWLTGMQVK